MPGITPELMDAARRVIATHGWSALSMDRLAVEAGISRATLHRRGVTPNLIRESLANLAVRAYRDAVWPALTAAGTGRERLTQLLRAVMDVSESDLALLAGLQSSEKSPFHAGGRDELLTETPFTDPIVRLLRDGEADGSLAPGDHDETATLVFNAVGWTYVHLRLTHRWHQARAQDAVLRLIMNGL
jgi:AcrR family transcriptional regulator